MAVSLKLADAYIDLRVDQSGLGPGLSSALASLNARTGQGVKLGVDTVGFNADLARARGGFASFAAGAARTAAGIGLARLGGEVLSAPVRIGGAMLDAAKKASDLGESVSKVGVTFGPAAGDVIGKTDQLATRFGVVKQEALDAAAGFGLMALAAGQTKEQAAQTGNRFVQMGLDIASFHNMANAEAFEKLRSGLAGEIEPLRAIGILLSEDAVQAKALQMGLVGTAAEAKHLTQQQKVAARTELIAEQMGPAMGDLERTADSAANQLRKLTGDIENTTVEFGKELQGALVAGIGLARDLGKVIAGWTGKEAPEAVGEVVKGVVDLGRTAAQGKGPGLLGQLNMGLGRAESAAFGALGLGENFLGVKDTLDAMEREQQAAVASATGGKLEAGPATGAEQIAAMKRSGDPAQLARVAESEAFAAALAESATERILTPGAGVETRPGLAMAREQDRIQAEMLQRERFEQGEGLDLRMNLELGKQFARSGGIPEVSKFAQGFRSPEDLAEIDRREAMAFIARPREERRAPSEMFADPAAYATSAIQSALSAKDDTGKATVEQLKIGNTLMKDLVDKILPKDRQKTNSGMLILQNP